LGDNEEDAGHLEQAIYDACEFVAQSPCVVMRILKDRQP
jgi:hypothetical protein